MPTTITKPETLLENLPKTSYDIVFVSNRILKGLPSIEDRIIPRVLTSDFPMESFIINFQIMSDTSRCHATVYIRGVTKTNQYNSRVWSSTTGRAIVGYKGWNCDGRFTDIGQLTIANMDELKDFIKVVDWTYNFLESFKEARSPSVHV